MRLFVSATVAPLSDAIADVQAPLRGLDGLRPTDPQQAHITMKFLGEGDHDTDALAAAIETAVADADTGPFEVSLEGVGVFPSLEYISVVWLGVGGGSRELTRLHEQLEAETTALGYDAESHEFTPHVTLARMDNAASKAEVQEFVQTADPDAGRVRLEELRLTESTLTPDGPEYETRRRFEL